MIGGKFTFLVSATLLGAAMTVAISTAPSGFTQARAGAFRDRTAGFRITAVGKQRTAWVSRVAEALEKVEPRVDRDFHVSPTRLTVRIYASHGDFGDELFRLEGVRPQSPVDNMGNVVHHLLPVGPNERNLAHSLAHVYTESVLDRLSHNSSDREPDPAWLYDGLAELEAGMVTHSLTCRLFSDRMLPALVSSPEEWWRVRGGPLAGVEYCQAEARAAEIVRHQGWRTVTRLLRRASSWQAFARSLGV